MKDVKNIVLNIIIWLALGQGFTGKLFFKILDIWKFTYLHCGGKMKLEDPRSLFLAARIF